VTDDACRADLSQNSAVPQKESGGTSPTPPARAYSASLGERGGRIYGLSTDDDARMT